MLAYSYYSLLIISLTLKNGIVPSQLKIAKILPIFKGGDPLSVDNYKPITLLNNFLKSTRKNYVYKDDPFPGTQ
jgi:hypothetical protein